MNRRVLIVDDDLVFIQLTENILIREGFYVFSASDAVEGFKAAKSILPDLLVLDVMMPKLNGYKFFKKLRSDDVTQDIPVMIVTSQADLREEFIGLGADSFISKPFKAQEFLTKVKSFFDGSRVLRLPIAILRMKRKRKWPFSKPEILEKPAASSDWQKRVIVCGDEKNLTDFIAAEIQDESCDIDVVSNAQRVVDRVIEWYPDLVLLPVQMAAHSVSEVIQLLNQVPGLHTNILIYSFFRDVGQEKNSIVHRLYLNKAIDFNKNEGVQIQYFGAIQKDSFKRRIKRFIFALRGLKY